MPDTDVFTFPPVELATDEELIGAVPEIPLVRDTVRLAGWTGVRQVTEHGLLAEQDARAAVAELGLDGTRLHLLWMVAVGGRLIEVDHGRARPGPGMGNPMEFWDGAVMRLLDRAEHGLTGSRVVDEHLIEVLATIYSVRRGMPLAALAGGILQAHEIGCAARRAELRRLRMTLPGDLVQAIDLLRYCGLIDVCGDLVRLTRPGVWAVRRDLIREGHDAPSLTEVVAFAGHDAADLIDAILAGRVSASAASVWLERRAPEDAARELVKIAASGNAAQRGTAGTILDELGPEAERAVREALDEPMMWRYAAAWLGVRDLPAPALAEADGAWVAVDTLAALLHIAAPVDSVAHFDILGQDLLALVPEMGRVDHPDTLAVLELLGRHHPDPAIAKAARKAAMKARSRP